VGDCLIAAAFLCFMGPYPNDYRIEINKAVMEFVKHSKIVKYSTNFTFEGFMTSASQIREWQVKELPTDDFSTQNAVLITKSHKFPTIIDPQGMAKTWIKKKTGKYLKVIDFKNKDYNN